MTKLKPKSQGKTGADLARLYRRMGWCNEDLLRIIEQRAGDLAEDIGLAEGSEKRLNRLTQLLFRMLRPESRVLFRQRLLEAGVENVFCICHRCLPVNNNDRARRVIEDCWRAWCRS